MSKQKKIIIKISCFVFGIIILCTFLSSSIANALVAKADITNVIEASISEFIDVTPEASRTDIVPIYAKSSGVFSEGLVREGNDIKQGEALYSFESGETDISLKQAELSVLNLENQLKQSKLIDDEIEQQKLLLKSAENDLAALENTQELDTNYIKLINTIQQLYTDVSNQKINSEYNNDELVKRLSIARQTLYDYDGTVTDDQSATIAGLISSIASLEASVSSNSLTQFELDEAKKQISDAKNELSRLREPKGIDTQREQLKLEISSLYQQISIAEQSTITQAESLTSQLEIAQKDFELYAKNAPLEKQSAYNRASVALMQAAQSLKTKQIEKSQINSVQLQLEIAKDQLNLQKAKSPAGGVHTSQYNGTVYKYFKKQGDDVQKGDVVLYIYSQTSKPALKFSLSNKIGGDYSTGSRLNVQFREFSLNSETLVSESFMSSLEATVSLKIYEEETDEYVFYATYDESKYHIPRETTITAQLFKDTATYDTVVPVASVFTAPNGESFVYIIETKDSLFAQEKYAKKIPVRIFDSNYALCAISAAEIKKGDEVIQFLSKSINDGDKVNINV